MTILAFGVITDTENVSIYIQEEKKGGGSKGGPPALVGTREYEQSDWNW